MMKHALLVSLALVIGAPAAHADATADVTAAFTAFVDGIAKDKLAKGVELFIGPAPQFEPLPKQLAPIKAMVLGAGFKNVKVSISKGGTSAWVYADIDKLRTSSFLTFDGTAWTVAASHWSSAVPIYKGDGCGDLGDDWQLPANVPAAATEAVAAVTGAGEETYWKLTSTDKAAMWVGGAAKDKTVGGKSIQKKLKKLALSPNKSDDDVVPARAGVGADGEMAWVSLTVGTMARCTNYRALLVLAKEKAGWRIVHQHYSVPVGDSDEE
jgi:hypothetical protein